jgi:hypothetical protein
VLIELEIKEKNVDCPIVNRLFFDNKSGGISTMPVMAERGADKDSEVAKFIARSIQSSNYK